MPLSSLRNYGVWVTLLLTSSSICCSAFQPASRPFAAATGRSRLFQPQSRLQPLVSPTSGLFATDDDDDDEEPAPYFRGDALIQDTSRALKRTSWLSWWSQVILTTVSSVTLLFARNVVKRSLETVKGVDGFFLAGCGLVTSFLSIIWTWGGARLARRLGSTEKDTTRIAAANMLRRAVRVAVSLNLIGILLTVLGAEQIIGILAVKVLTMQGVIGTGAPGSAAVATQTLQPLDILVVQANTNTLLSHFCGLVLALYLTRFIDKLDPPSVENDERKRKR